MLMPALPYNEKEVEQAIQAVKDRFPDDVDRVGFSFHNDWSGDPSLYFRVLLSDRFHGKYALDDPDLRRHFREVTQGVQEIVRDVVSDPDLHLYVNFRTISEQRELRDPRWEE